VTNSRLILATRPRLRSLLGFPSCNIIPRVVRVRAWESLAASYRSWAVLGEDLLDAIGVGGVDNSGNVEVGRAGVAVEAQLSEHAWDVRGSLGDGVEVANPACGEGLVGRLVAFDGELLDCWEAFLGGEVDGSLFAALVDKVDCVGAGSDQGCKCGGCEEDCAEELHFEIASVFFI
jgi:hypothetical protein